MFILIKFRFRQGISIIIKNKIGFFANDADQRRLECGHKYARHGQLNSGPPQVHGGLLQDSVSTRVLANEQPEQGAVECGQRGRLL